MNQPTTIDAFSGEHRFLSNFFILQPNMKFGPINAPTVEHLFQASKTLDPVQRTQILRASGPRDAKRLGRSVTLRNDWDHIRIPVMEALIEIKFGPAYPKIMYQLLATGDAQLVEGNNWRDTFWGVDSRSGKGENNMGKILMKRRAELQKMCDDGLFPKLAPHMS